MIPGWIIPRLLAEIAPKIEGGTIKEVTSPAPGQVFLHLLPNDRKLREIMLVISLHPQLFTVFLTNAGKDTDKSDRRMLHLLSGIVGMTIQKIEQKDNDRILNITFDEDLRVELHLFGPNSSLLLYKNNLPIGAYPERIMIAKSSVKKLPQETLLGLSPDIILAQIQAADPSQPLAGILRNTYREIDAELSKAITLALNLTVDAKLSEIAEDMQKDLAMLLCELSKALAPTGSFYLCGDKDGYPYLSPLPLSGALHCASALDSPNQALQELYKALEGYLLVKDERNKLAAKINQALKNLLRRQKHLNEDLIRAQSAPGYRLFAETILGNLKSIVKGANPLELPSPYSETGETISIPMNINKTPQGNAQYYFNLARRLEKAQARIQVQILAIEKELAKIPKELPEEINVLKELANRLGLTDEKKEPKAKAKKAGEKKLAGIISFPLSDGSIIYVGRNAEGNNRLTFQIAKGEDLWFHTRDAHGSHVILSAVRKGELPLRKNILLAAGLTAYFSKLRQDSKVEVAYTRAKYVRKTKKLGLVTYSQEKSLLVKPISPEEMRKKLGLGNK